LYSWATDKSFIISSGVDGTRVVRIKTKVRRQWRISLLSGSCTTGSETSGLSFRNGTRGIQSLSYKLSENRRAIDDVDFRHPEMIRVLRAKNDIHPGVVEEQVRKTFVCGGGFSRWDGRHCLVVSCDIGSTLGTLNMRQPAVMR
jgi:hypothetical protein